MLWLLSKIYYSMINDHVHCFDNQRFYEWGTDLPAVMKWIVKKALAMMILFKFCLRIVLQFCFLFNQEQKKQPKGIYVAVNKYLTGLIRRTHFQIQRYRLVCFCCSMFTWPLSYGTEIDSLLLFLTMCMGECHQVSLFVPRFLEWKWWFSIV